MKRDDKILDVIQNGQSAMPYTLVDLVKNKYPNYFQTIKSPRDYVKWLVVKLVKEKRLTEKNGRWYKL